MAWSPQTVALGLGDLQRTECLVSDLRLQPSHRNATGLGASIPKPTPVPGEDAAPWDALPAGPHTSRGSLGYCRLGVLLLARVPELPPTHTHQEKQLSSCPLVSGALRAGPSPPAHAQLYLCSCSLCSRMSWWSAFGAGVLPAWGPHSQGGLWTPVVSAGLRGEQCWLD